MLITMALPQVDSTPVIPQLGSTKLDRVKQIKHPQINVKAADGSVKLPDLSRPALKANAHLAGGKDFYSASGVKRVPTNTQT